MKKLHKKIIAGALGGMLMLGVLAGFSGSNLPSDSENTVARKVNEYEGQHRVSVVASLGDPSQWGVIGETEGPSLLKKGSFD